MNTMRSVARAHAEIPPQNATASGATMRASADAVICMLLETVEPTSEVLSEMASNRDGYGLALLSLAAITKVSEVSPCAVKGSALTLLHSFLERLDISSAEGGGGLLRLKSLGFADNTIGPLEAPVIFAALPFSLEDFSIQGNPLGIAETDALAEAVKAGRLASVRRLNLARTDLHGAKMRSLCSAFEAAKPLRVESLSLGGLDFPGEKTLSAVLHKRIFPFLRELNLAQCTISHYALRNLFLPDSLAALETLVLDGVVSFSTAAGCGAFVGGVRGGAVPHLKTLSMKGIWVAGSWADALISALTSEIAAPLVTAPLCVSLFHATEETAQALGSGKVGFVRGLEVCLGGSSAVAFFQELINAPTQSPWNCVHLYVDRGETASENVDAMNALADAVRTGRLHCVRKMSFGRDVLCVSPSDEGGAGVFFFLLGFVPAASGVGGSGSCDVGWGGEGWAFAEASAFGFVWESFWEGRLGGAFRWFA
uniref:Uncharacterized protein n=1 Tax=Chromera velia CCMP2878 TaxID=1169474 RepID=A0A0G4I3B7_9ALVE|eukprot:Cvel_10622.t1-p1 / transcript=Cvel_10622.t1 / gene=Cvel_10622 / organism=Chromera_velia_CCMP2878 / gene_product=hypothetical protein / transcript_product=hypothetical protein / location=Cvel_scaffold645:6895-9462(-) / protein_length=481 / sequence_SO=supercontig / SO=protein_coding / is_pseudo=false